MHILIGTKQSKIVDAWIYNLDTGPDWTVDNGHDIVDCWSESMDCVYEYMVHGQWGGQTARMVLYFFWANILYTLDTGLDWTVDSGHDIVDSG